MVEEGLRKYVNRAAVVALVLAASAWATPKYKILHGFGGSSDGAGPWGGVTPDAAGNLYGTTRGGGGNGCNGSGCGTIFQMTPRTDGHWKETVLYRFNGNESAFPVGTPVFDMTGNLYGTTNQGYGEVFELLPGQHGWSLRLLHTGGGYFTLLLDKEGNLYAPLGANAISELVKDDGWAESALYSFCSKNNRQHRCLDGSEPFAGVTWGPEGSLYGTTVEGGSAGYGVVFQLTPQEDGTWSESLLHSFPATKDDGQKLYNSVTLDHVGNIYSATYQGGANDCGVIFKLAPRASGKWKETILYDFPKLSLGCSANTLTFDAKGNLWGTAGGGGKYGDGVVFELTRRKNGKWTYHVVHQFNGADGALPASAVIFDKRGNLYGTTVLGGPGSSVGVVFEITP